MSVTPHDQAPRHTISAGRERYLAHGDDLMMVVIDFDDGPAAQPDPPHHHPHEQITYMVEGRAIFFLGDTSHEISAGDLIVVPPNVPHSIQTLTAHVRLVDTFHPIRADFLNP